MKCFKSTHFSTIALQMLHRWHLSHHKNDGKRTMEVFKTKDNKGSPSWEVQHRPWAPSWDVTLLVSSQSLGLKSHCRFESLWLLSQQAELRRGLYAYNLEADPVQKDQSDFPWGTGVDNRRENRWLTRFILRQEHPFSTLSSTVMHSVFPTSWAVVRWRLSNKQPVTESGLGLRSSYLRFLLFQLPQAASVNYNNKARIALVFSTL